MLLWAGDAGDSGELVAIDLLVIVSFLTNYGAPVIVLIMLLFMTERHTLASASGPLL